MYIETVPNRKSRPAVLLREGWREGKKVKKRTLANLTDWPKDKVDALRMALSGVKLMALEEALDKHHTRIHGQVDAVLKTVKKLEHDEELFMAVNNEIYTESIKEVRRLEEELQLLPQVSQARATVLGRGKKAEVHLSLHVTADAELAPTADEASQRARALMEDRMGLSPGARANLAIDTKGLTNEPKSKSRFFKGSAG